MEVQDMRLTDLVLDFIDGKTFDAEDVRDPGNLERAVALMRRCHHDIPRYLRGPALVFWVCCYGMSKYSQHIERKLHTGHKR